MPDLPVAGRDRTAGQLDNSDARSAVIRARVGDPSRLAAVTATTLLDSDFEEVFDRLTRLAGAVLDVRWAFVTLVDDKRSFWKSCFGTGAVELSDRQNAVEESFCQYVVATGDPLLIDDARLDERTKLNPSIESMGVIAWAGSPLLSADGHVLGTFCVVSSEPRRWSAADASVLETLAGAAASEIQLRTALTTARDAADALSAELAIRDEIGRRSELMSALALELSAAATADEVAHIVASTGRGVLGALFVNLDLVDPSNRHLTVIHSPSVPSTIVERYSTITLDESTAPGCAVLQRRPMIASTFAEFAAQWPTVADDAASIGLRAAGAWPMFLADGTVLGALSAGWSTDTEFGVLLRSALLTMAQMAAASLERTRIGDLRAAFVVALQHALLPTLPSPTGVDVAARYLPADNDLGLGGDWYDVFTASPSRVGVIVGDVCGHGIQAAATMALLRGTLNALVRQNHTNLTDVFANAEAWLVAEPDFVATVAVHVVDTNTDTLHYLSAGHPPSVLVRPDGSYELLEAARRPVLGISGPKMPNGRVRFPPGAILVACTDGLLERRDRTLDEGLSTVASIATEHRRGTAEDIAAALEKSINISPSDDIAFVVLKRTTTRSAGPLLARP